MTTLTLRPLELADAVELSAWAGDDVFCEHAGWTKGTDPADTSWWEATISSPPPELLRLGAIVDAELVGCVDLHGLEPGVRELGYEIGPSARWGRGYGTLAARAGLDYGFRVLGLERIWAEAVAANVPSVRILERLGMQYTGPGDDEPFLGLASYYRQYAISRDAWDASRESA